MTEKEKYYERYETQKGTYICAKCNIPLEPGKVILQYMGNDFPVELPKCPKCGHQWIKRVNKMVLYPCCPKCKYSLNEKKKT